MKANLPKSWQNLPRREKDAITAAATKFIKDQVNHEEAEIQKIWIQLACIILHDTFGFGAQRLTTFIGNWKRIYRRNKKIHSVEEQDEYLKTELAKIFGPDGFPYEFLDSLEEL